MLKSESHGFWKLTYSKGTYLHQKTLHHSINSAFVRQSHHFISTQFSALHRLSAHCNVHLSCKIHTSWQCLQKKQSTPGACNSQQICDRQGSSLREKRKVHLKIKCCHHLLTSMSGYQHSFKYILYKQNKLNSYRFGTTWGWVNDDWIKKFLL